MMVWPQRCFRNFRPAEEISDPLHQGRFCEAARLYSSWWGTDYLDNKFLIDRLAHKHGLAPRSGCAGYFMRLVAAIGAVIWCGIG